MDRTSSPLLLLHRAGQAATALFQGDALSTLTLRQVSVLRAAAAHGGASQKVLAEVTGADRSTMSEIIRRLNRKGYLHRRRSKTDARVWMVALTDAGRELLREADPKVARTEQQLLACIAPRRRKAFVEALRLIAKELGGE